MKEEPRHRGGKRDGAGRKPEGKKAYTVTLTSKNVDKAKRKEANFSGLLDSLLADWLGHRT
jgi:Post-segregation antitoxin CcdA